MMRARLAIFALVLIAVALAARPALAQWTPQVNLSPLRDVLVTALAIITYISVLVVIVYSAAKLLYGRMLASTGAPGVAMRGYAEKFEAFTGIVWFCVAILLLPFIVYILAQMKVLPDWVAEEWGDIIREIWTGEAIRRVIGGGQ